MSVWRERAGPWARVTLPDGQGLDVVVVARIRTPDGAWQYECEVILPAVRRHPDGRTESVAAPTPVTVAAPDIVPIPGEVYTAVPTRGAAVPGRRWLLSRVTSGEPDGPAWTAHRSDCAQASGTEPRTATTEETAALLRTAAAAPCTVCRPDRALPG